MILFSILVKSVLKIDVQCLVLEDDGTEIEYDAVLEAFKGCTIIALSEGETWIPKALNIDRVNDKCDNGDKSKLQNNVPSAPHILREDEEPILQSLSRATQGETDQEILFYFEKKTNKCLMMNGT